MLFEIVRLVLDSIASLLAFGFLLRALMQWVRLHPRNPLAPFVFSLTDWLVKPLRRVVPGFAGLDWASLLGAVLTAVGLHFGLFLFAALLSPGQWTAMVSAWLFVTAFLWLIRTALFMLMGIVLIQAILSWVNPFSPIYAVMTELSEPFLKPLRRFIPRLGNVDITPLVLLLVVQILLALVQR